jgi:hypothetical protein
MAGLRLCPTEASIGKAAQMVKQKRVQFTNRYVNKILENLKRE